MNTEFRLVIVLSLCPFIQLLSKKPSSDADFNIAGLYTIHSTTLSLTCDTIKPDDVILSEAHQFAVEYANREILSLRNLQMGDFIKDTCDDRSTTLQEIVGMIGSSKGFCTTHVASSDFNSTMIALVGYFECDLAENINYLLQAFCIPVISSACTSSQMDDSTSYPLFARTIASDAYRAQVMVDVLISQEFYHISMIYDASMVGMSLKSEFTNLIYWCGITDGDDLFRSPCIEDTIQLSFFKQDAHIKNQLDEFRRVLSATTVKVFVVFMEPDAINAMLSYIEAWGYKTGEIQFILPTIELNTSLSDAMEYSYAVETYTPLVAEFVKRLDTISIAQVTNPFLSELIMIDNQCCLPDVPVCPFSIFCNGSERLRTKPYIGIIRSRLVIDAISLIAHTIVFLHDKFCEPGEKICWKLREQFTGRTFFDSMMKMQFQSIESTGCFRLLNRSGIPMYNIYQRQNHTWEPVLLHYNPLLGPEPNPRNQQPIDIYDHSRNINLYEEILSEAQSCQAECFDGEPDFGKGCCWTCKKCDKFSFLNDSVPIVHCESCPAPLVPNKALNGCVEFYDQNVLFFRPSEEIMFMIGFSALGCLITIPPVILIIWKKNTPMVLAATPDLSYTQAVVTLGLFSTSGFMIPSPHAIVCATVWAFSAIFLAACHSVFLMKALRISRPHFFVRLADAARTPARASGLLIAVFVLLQVFVVTIWLILRTPKIEVDRERNTHLCSSNNEIQTVVLLVIPLLLLLTSIVFQRKACGVAYIYQVHQARVGIAGSLCFVANYAVLIPLIFVEESAEDVKAVILMCVPMLTGYVAWLTMLVPTTYEVLYCQRSELLTKPKQNAKEYVTRERSRQFQEGNVMYFVESVVFNRPKGLTMSSTASGERR